MSGREAVMGVHNALSMWVGDAGPDEFAMAWIREATESQLADLIEMAKSLETYSRREGNGASSMFKETDTVWALLSYLIEAWATHAPRHAIDSMTPLLSHPVGRRAAIWALNSTVRSHPSMYGEISGILKGRIGDLQDLSEDEKDELDEIECYASASGNGPATAD